MKQDHQNYKTVRTDFGFIDSSMASLKTKVDIALNYCDNNDPTIHPEKDGNMLYSKMNGIMNKYTLAQKVLMEKLNHEINSVRTVGEAYYKMNKQLEGDANKL